ncbi:hypothetical protein GCM10009548_36420 [Streptomyces malaysiensis subsp. malaysiensis]
MPGVGLNLGREGRPPRALPGGEARFDQKVTGGGFQAAAPAVETAAPRLGSLVNGWFRATEVGDGEGRCARV